MLSLGTMLALASFSTYIGAGLLSFVGGMRLRRAVGTSLLVLGGLLGLAATVAAMVGDTSYAAGPFAGLGAPRFHLDGVSAAFLVPISLLEIACAVFALGYWSDDDQPRTASRLRALFGWAGAGIVLVLVATDPVHFLAGWEVMALAAFLMLTVEDHDPHVTRAGFTYLIATHVGVLCLFGLFAALATPTPMPGRVVIALGVVGFGLKAGFVPLHVWLPPAHAAAPSHVSAVMSGAFVKVGIYGLVRLGAAFPSAGLAATLLVLGGLSAVLGIAFALVQTDLKRVLAYSTVENVGLILLGLGLAVVGRAQGDASLVVLGLGGAVLHSVNHAVLKGLLFLGAGATLHATHGARDLDRLGGLLRRIPRTATTMLIGAAAITGLPPLSAFASELCLMRGGLGALDAHRSGGALAALVVPLVGLVAALALAAFVRLVGIGYLGEPRSTPARHAHEPERLTHPLLAPLVGLAGLAVLLGLAPILLAPLVDVSVGAFLAGTPLVAPRLIDVVPLGWLSLAAVALFALVALGWSALEHRLMQVTVRSAPTWGCAYHAPTPRMQYTATSLSQLIADLFSGVLRPRTQAPVVHGLHPQPTHFATHVGDPILDRAVPSVWHGVERLLFRVRVLQQGRVQGYILYVLVCALVLLLWELPDVLADLPFIGDVSRP